VHIHTGVEVWRQSFGRHSGSSNKCGHTRFAEEAVPVDVTVPHIAPSASIRVTTTLDGTAYDESWGIRGFKL